MFTCRRNLWCSCSWGEYDDPEFTTSLYERSHSVVVRKWWKNRSKTFWYIPAYKSDSMSLYFPKNWFAGGGNWDSQWVSMPALRKTFKLPPTRTSYFYVMTSVQLQITGWLKLLTKTSCRKLSWSMFPGYNVVFFFHSLNCPHCWRISWN